MIQDKLLFGIALLFSCSVWGNTHDLKLPLLLKPQHFAIMRHSSAPGFGDPSQFNLKDCTTQRNLSPQGRAEALKLGKTLTDTLKGRRFKVYSSQWCRCLETARLLDLGEVKELPLLNSFFSSPSSGQSQTFELKQWLQTNLKTFKEPILLITHQVNITELLGVYPESGEVFIVHFQNPQKLEIIKRIKTSQYKSI